MFLVLVVCKSEPRATASSTSLTLFLFCTSVICPPSPFFSPTFSPLSPLLTLLSLFLLHIGVLQSAVVTLRPSPPGSWWVSSLDPCVLAFLLPVLCSPLLHHMFSVLILVPVITVILLTSLGVWLIWVILFQVAVAFDLPTQTICYINDQEAKVSPLKLKCACSHL